MEKATPPPPERERSWLSGQSLAAPWRYGVALSSVLLAWAARAALDPVLEDAQPFATFYMAITFVAWWAGWRPAVVAVILGYFLAHWFFLPPRHALAIEDVADVVQHLAYFFVTGTIVLLMESLRRARGRAAALAQLAEENERKLETDICERIEAQEALRETESRFQAMAEMVPDILFTSGPDGLDDYVNQRFYDYTGMAPGAAAGEGWAKALYPEDAERVKAEWRECVRTGRVFDSQYRLRTADGGCHWFMGRARPIRDEQGRIIKWFGCCTDIDEQKRNAEVLEQKVAERTARLQELLNEMEHFSYSIVHDMRAPLRAMLSYAFFLGEELCEGCLRSQNLEYLNRIKAAAGRMDNLIQDALNYSRVVREDLPLHPVDLSRLLRDLIKTYPNLQAHQADIHLEGEIPPVLGNEAGLTQCFANLLDNAAKFVAPGTVPQVRVWAESREDKVRVWVEDNGIGIPRELQNRIWDMFQRANTRYEGTGIGLAIVRKAAQRMGGKAGVESEPDKGSRFWVELREESAS